jgi:hypothetical protein
MNSDSSVYVFVSADKWAKTGLGAKPQLGNPISRARAYCVENGEWEEFFEREARAKGVTKDEIREAWAKFMEEQIFDKMVEDGTFRSLAFRAGLQPADFDRNLASEDPPMIKQDQNEAFTVSREATGKCHLAGWPRTAAAQITAPTWLPARRGGRQASQIATNPMTRARLRAYCAEMGSVLRRNESAPRFMSTPARRTRCACCAQIGNGVRVALQSPAMKSRRFIRSSSQFEEVVAKSGPLGRSRPGQ